MVVAALAGRRVDAAGSAVPSFPAAEIGNVKRNIERVFVEERVQLLISSCAAGADILALEIADHMQIDWRVILPFDVVRFRAVSVTDRDLGWGKSYDTLIDKATRLGQLRIIDGSCPDEVAYTRTNHFIIHEAMAAAAPEKPIAIVVWDNRPRSSADFTNEFRQLALKAGMRERVILTR